MRSVRQISHAITIHRPSRILHALHYAGHVLRRWLNGHRNPLAW